MDRVLHNKILVVLFGLVIGTVLGGYVGLVLGGTFLGGFDIYDKFGLEGYEITLYIGAILGALISLPLSFKFAKKFNRS